ncbi:MAG: hypothetical protein AABY90_02035, partial [Nitrospirota bacterium]
MTKLAILDIGTNSIHLVLAEVEPDFSYKILDRFKDMTRLGDGAFKTRRLSEAAMARGLEVIRTLATLARNKGYERVEAVDLLAPEAGPQVLLDRALAAMAVRFTTLLGWRYALPHFHRFSGAAFSVQEIAGLSPQEVLQE